MPCVLNTFHRVVFRRSEMLIAGRIHHYRITNLRNAVPFQGAAPDPVMHIVAPNGDILAENDDFTGLASEVIFTPAADGPATVIIRAFNTKTPGLCNLEKGLDGVPPTPLNTNFVFWGVTGTAMWNAGDVFSTSNSSGDPFFFLRTDDGKMFRDDDSGGPPPLGRNSRFVAPTAGGGRVILGSFSRFSEGVCDLCLDAPGGPMTLNLDQSERPYEPGRERERKTEISPQMEQYLGELLKSKEALEELDPSEREQQVRELQERILTEEERYPMALPAPQAAADFVRLQKVYLERYREMERELEALSYEDRAERVTALKTQIVGPS